MDGRYLQIDHRIPYEVVGDREQNQIDQKVPDFEDFMLLDASNQRTKSWSCENCNNWKKDRIEAICRSCFWAFPENYTHIAGKQIRRVVIQWSGSEVDEFDRLQAQAQSAGISVSALLKRLSKS